MSLIEKPMHPGEVLAELYLEPANLTPIKLARALKVPRTRIERLVKGETNITTDTAVRLAKFFGSSPHLWMNMQTNYDIVALNDQFAKAISEIEPMEVSNDNHADRLQRA